MTLLISLALAELFFLLCAKPLKKYPGIFYGAAALISAAVTMLYWAAPEGLSPGVLNKFPLWLGALGTACFIEVMAVGAMPNGHPKVKQIMPIRGELSIFACLLTLGQNLSYGKNYLTLGFLCSGPISAVKIAAWVSVVMIVLMLVLTVTSIKAVRRRFPPKRWKALQRWAYLFYGLIYVHVLLMDAPGFLKGQDGRGLTLLMYSVVFLSYAVCRVRKSVLVRKGQAAKVTGRTQLAGIAAGAALSLILVGGLYRSVQSVEPALGTPQISNPDGQESESPAVESQPGALAVPPPINTEEQPEPTPEPEETLNPIEADLPEQSSVSPQETEQIPSSSAPTPSSAPIPTPGSVPEATPEPTLEPTPEPALKYQNGTFTGTGEGYYGPVTVSVTISQDVITSIVINSYLDDEDYFGDAQASVVSSILSRQSPDVSAVSGATYSSKGIMSAVRDALAKAEN